MSIPELLQMTLTGINLGVMYANGDDVQKNEVKAAELYQQACDLKIGGGCNNLAILFGTGRGVRQDLGKAKELFGKACDLKFESGCANYATF